ncbi:MAG: XrtA/PEP-CTERM system exopolysaccharide export protein [Steroidobacteraceae bacterium]
MTTKHHGRASGRRVIATALLAGSMWLSGCAATPTGAQGDGRARTAAADVCPKAEYKIGPGDELNIFVYDEKDLSGPVPVRPDGYISMPLIDRIAASGKTPTELARAIEQRLGEYLRAPKVNVIVTHFVGTLEEQIRIVGQGVQKPLALPYKRGTKVMDVVIQAGALAPYASLNHARILRRGPNGKETEIRVRLGDLLNRGDVRQNKDMCPGDVLVIPETMF